MTRTSLTTAIAPLLSVLLFMPVTASCQDINTVCQQLKDGIYYYYPTNSARHFVCTRQGALQWEIEQTTHDSASWKVDWESPCVYTLKYMGGDTQMKPEVQKFLKKHKEVFKVDTITEDYYTYTSYIDYISTTYLKKDTLWFREKASVSNNELFSIYDDEAALQQDHFSDTSRYAVLYLYRPGRLPNSLLSSLVYCNDNLLWVCRNNSGRLVRILKEGEIQLKNKRYGDESIIKLNIRFGKKYYVKALDHWNLSGGKLELTTISPEEGKAGFSQVKIMKVILGKQ